MTKLMQKLNLIETQTEALSMIEEAFAAGEISQAELAELEEIYEFALEGEEV